MKNNLKLLNKEKIPLGHIERETKKSRKLSPSMTKPEEAWLDSHQ